MCRFVYYRTIATSLQVACQLVDPLHVQEATENGRRTYLAQGQHELVDGALVVAFGVQVLGILMVYLGDQPRFVPLVVRHLLRVHRVVHAVEQFVACLYDVGESLELLEARVRRVQ